MAKALAMFHEWKPVNEHTRLIHPDGARRLIATVDTDLRPCSRDECTTLVAKLVGAYPELAKRNHDPDYKVYLNHLFEAFQQFSFAIGQEIVHGGTGLPADLSYTPKPADIVKFGKALVDKRVTARAMALAHLKEYEEREKRRHEDAALPTLTAEERKAFVAQMLGKFNRMEAGAARPTTECRLPGLG
jgi:hypothetical protein